MKTHLWALSALAAGAATAHISDVRGETTSHRVGRLTCITDVAASAPAVDAHLSCHFESLAGMDGRFTGYIVRKGAAGVPPGKRVLEWTVSAQRGDVEARLLAGKYEGQTGGPVCERLIRGETDSIVLRPATVASQLGDKVVPSVLVLRLVPAIA